MMSVDKHLVREGDVLAEGVDDIPKYTVVTEDMKVKIKNASSQRISLAGYKEVMSAIDSSSFLRVQLASFFMSHVNIVKVSDETMKMKAMELVYEELLKDVGLLKMFLFMFKGNDSLLEHCLNTGVYSALLTDDVRIIRGCLYHDIGKLSTPYCILNKRGSLTKDEVEIINKHTSCGVELVDDTTFDVVKDIILHHHEKLDGTGYPDKLTDISLGARICAICDIFDAITASRCYKVPMSVKEALHILVTDADAGKVDKEIVLKLRDIVVTYSVGCIVELTDGKIGVLMKSVSADSFIICVEDGDYLSDVKENMIKTVI